MTPTRDSSQRVYLDHAATTPVRPEVRAAMEPFLTDEAFGNPSSAHWAGRPARAALAEARECIAAAVGAEPHQVVFTSGGTEADNLAVLGGALAARATGRPFRVAVSAIGSSMRLVSTTMRPVSRPVGSSTGSIAKPPRA